MALRLSIVGCGDISGYTAWFARLNRGIRMTACCDLDAEIARNFARKFAIPASYSDYMAMLANAPLDAVYLAVPHDLHRPMTEQAVDAGLAVFLEKPLAASLEDGEALTDFIARVGGKVAVNYQYRYDAACYGMAQAARSGALGRLLYARINVPWSRQADYFRRSGAWHSSLARSGGGTLLTQGSHFLDAALWAGGDPPVSALGYRAQRRFQKVEVEDLAFGVVELANGAAIEIASSMAAATEQAATIELYGERATAHYRDGLIPRLSFSGARVRAPRPPVRGLHALQRSLEAFRQFAVAGRPTLCTVPEALRTLRVVDAIYRAAAGGQRVPIASRDRQVPANQ